MKNLLISLIFVMTLQSCREEPSLIPDIYWGEASATKNGQPWSGLIYAQPNEPYGYWFDISIRVFNTQEFLRESLFFFKIPYAIQNNQIDTIEARVDTTRTGAFYATLVDDGDVVGDIFDVYNGESENYISVTSYDKSSGEVRGEFAVTFVFDVTDNRSDPTAPDTIRFTNGQFHTKIRENL